MIAIISTVAWLVLMLAGLPLVILCLELFAGLPSGGHAARSKASARVAVLIPAHDEAAGIADTIRALKEIAPPATRILVIADNCSDATAALAKSSGAEVIERQDELARGKGFALAFGRDHLASDRLNLPDSVVVLDADCRLSAGSIEALTGCALQSGKPAQAVNLISPDLAAAPMVQISSFAMVVKNLFRSRGMQRLGGAALLTGTGMCFPWPMFARANLATGSIVEDLSLGIELTREGYPPILVEQAHVRSAPADLRDALQQRKRWEHGFLDSLRNLAMPVLLGGLRRASRSEMLLGLHLMVPPLALSMALACLAFAVTCAFAWLGAQLAPAAVLGALLLLTTMLVLIAWLKGGQDFLSGRTLLRIPLYVAWKLPIYASFLRRPQVGWNRTPRRIGQEDDGE